MTRRTTYSLLLAAIIALVAPQLHAAPVRYGFTSSSVALVGGDPVLTPLLTGMTTAGTFKYDPAASALGVATDPQLAQSTIYGANVLTNLRGTIGARAFSDPLGYAAVGNDRFNVVLPPGVPSPFPPLDILLLSADPPPGSAPLAAYDFNGFQLAGMELVGVRMFWLEMFVGGAVDFLSDQNLPANLPSFGGRLAFDFVSPANPSALKIVFFDSLIVTQLPDTGVPAPGAGLVVVGLLLAGFARRMPRAR